METAGPLSYAECVAALVAAREALAVLPSVTWQASGTELARGLEVLGEVSALGEGAEVAIVIDAVDRGEPAAAAPPLSPREWVAAHHRRYAAAGAAGVADLAVECLDARHGVLREAVTSGRVSVATARVAVKEMRALTPHLVPEAVDTVWAGMVALGERHDARTVRLLRERLLATHGRDGEFEETEERARVGASLSPGRQVAPGLWEYLLRVPREGRAVLEAAIGPLSAPRTGRDGERDERPHERRRAEALTAVVERAVKAGDGSWSATKAQVFVQVGLEGLQARVGAGSLLGGLGSGELVSVETVRRWACDASIIPAVLNGAGEVVDLGRAQRYFTPGQVKALWLRDRHCTYPGCDAPAAWTDAHHLIHWVDGGPSDISNAALLCQRHHTIVHSQRYHGWVETGGHGSQRVVWDLTRGAYDDALAGVHPHSSRAAPSASAPLQLAASPGLSASGAAPPTTTPTLMQSPRLWLVPPPAETDDEIRWADSPAPAAATDPEWGDPDWGDPESGVPEWGDDWSDDWSGPLPRAAGDDNFWPRR